MANQYVSRVVYNGQILIDLTSDTVVADKLLSGYTAHGKDGAPITGICTFDADTSDATVTESEILVDKTAYARGIKITGKMPNNGAITKYISTVAGEVAIPQGYHDGGGKVSISAAEQAKIIASNIREGVTILGVLGTASGTEGVKAETREVTPTAAQQVITPNSDEGYNYLAQVTVLAIPYVETDNAAGGKTVTIATPTT